MNVQAISAIFIAFILVAFWWLILSNLVIITTWVYNIVCILFFLLKSLAFNVIKLLHFRLDLLKDTKVSLSANHLQKLRLSFQLTTPLGHTFKPHQVATHLVSDTMMATFFLHHLANVFRCSWNWGMRVRLNTYSWYLALQGSSKLFLWVSLHWNWLR